MPLTAELNPCTTGKSYAKTTDLKNKAAISKKKTNKPSSASIRFQTIFGFLSFCIFLAV